MFYCWLDYKGKHPDGYQSSQFYKYFKHEEQVYNSYACILHFYKGIPHGIVEEASCKCIEMHACKYSYFKRFLGTVATSTDPGSGGKSLPSHENIRVL